MLVNFLETAESLRPECLQQDESSAVAAMFSGARATVLLAVLLILLMLQYLVSKQCHRYLTPRKIDDFSVRLDFLETVVYQVTRPAQALTLTLPRP